MHIAEDEDSAQEDSAAQVFCIGSSVFPKSTAHIAEQCNLRAACRPSYTAQFITRGARMMANENSQLLNDTVFGLLPQSTRRTSSFGASMLLNVTVAALAVVLSISQVRVLQVRAYQSTPLLFPVKQPRPYIPPVPKIKTTSPLVAIKPKIELSKPKPTVEPPKIAQVNLPVSLPLLETAPPRRVELSREPTAKVQGRFGEPAGVIPNPKAEQKPTIAAQGVNFGSGISNAVSGGKDRGAVASAGFANGGVGGAGGAGARGTIAQAGFGTNQYGSGPALPQRPQQIESTPIVVLSKPLPAYTEEARQLKVEGDVTLQVRFTASGMVDVLRVINGLGHGLDEQAWIAAEHIRFKPATRDGHPVDEVSVIRVTFQLA
jgi:TonB family protein